MTLVRARWLERRNESAVQRALLAPLSPLGFAYGLGAWLHRTVWERGLLARRRLPCRVVSVGNLVLGGTGKTPTAAWLATQLRRRGHRVVLASRGYGRARADSLTTVSDGRFVHGDPSTRGDEGLVLASHAVGVPVLVGRDRGVAGLRAVSAFGADILVLDDGFQHHRLHRDIEILTLDGGLALGNRRVFPRGPLRERLSALSRAHVLLAVDGPLPEPDAALIDRHAPGALRFDARRRPVALRPLAGGPGVSLDRLVDLEVGMLAALARPAGFRATLEGLGARVVAERVFRDHHRYRPRDLRNLRRHAPVWITTEKDAVKIPPSWLRGADVHVLRIELSVAEAKPLLDWLEERLGTAEGD